MPPPYHPAGTGHIANPADAALGATSEPVEQWTYADYTQGTWASGGPSQARTTRSPSMSTESTTFASVFSAASDGQTWSDQTSIPADAPQPAPLLTHQAHLPATGGAHRADETLWCEHHILLSCTFTCGLDDPHSWIEHHINHLGGVDATFPRNMWCWFCNDLSIVVDHPANGYDCFLTRMEHIRQHIFEDRRWTSEHMRPDFLMVKHMYHRGLISPEVYRAVMSYSEVLLPGEAEYLYSATRPLGQQQQRLPSSSSRPDVVVDDLAKEKREERRRQKKGKGSEKRRK